MSMANRIFRLGSGSQKKRLESYPNTAGNLVTQVRTLSGTYPPDGILTGANCLVGYYTSAGIGAEIAGIVFPDVIIPQGRTIASATLRLSRTVNAPSGSDPYGFVKIGSNVNFETFATTPPDLRTTFGGPQIFNPGNGQNVFYDVRDILQQAVNQAGWNSPVVIILSGTPTVGDRELEFVSAVTASGTTAFLSVDYFV